MKGSLTPEESERAKALRADGRTFYAIARDLGRSAHTIKNFLSKRESVEDVDRRKPQLAKRYRELAETILNGVTAKDIEKANLTAKLIASGVAIDKALLLENGTPNVPNIQILLEIATAIRDDRRASPAATPSLPKGQQ